MTKYLKCRNVYTTLYFKFKVQNKVFLSKHSFVKTTENPLHVSPLTVSYGWSPKMAGYNCTLTKEKKHSLQHPFASQYHTHPQDKSVIKSVSLALTTSAAKMMI